MCRLKAKEQTNGTNTWNNTYKYQRSAGGCYLSFHLMGFKCLCSDFDLVGLFLFAVALCVVAVPFLILCRCARLTQFEKIYSTNQKQRKAKFL